MSFSDAAANEKAIDTKGAATVLDRVESYGIREGEVLTERAGTKRAIKSRHAQMIAIGGTIGTGLFVGSGQALARGGPLFLLICYAIISLMVYGIVTAIVEVATYLPISGGSMAYYAGRYCSPSLGFALGWLYFYSFGIIVAYEITAAGIVINYWPNHVHIAVWITMMLVVIVGLNFCPVGVYAEAEFWFASIKVVMITGLLILSLILCLGGGPSHDRLGFRYWRDPGATKEYIISGDGGRFTAFLYLWVFCAFSFYFGPELLIFTAGEMRNPRKNLPTAAKRFFWRLIVFYVLGALAIGVICNSDAKGLTSGGGNANASPWVIAIKNAGISVLPSIINVGVLSSAWSSGNSYLYMSSRALYSLAISGNAPKIFMRCNKHGLPIYAVIASSVFSLLAYLNAGDSAGNVFNWFINLTNTAGFTSWIVCCIVYLRFRKACTIQAVAVPYRSRIQPYASWVCLVLFVFLCLMNGFTVFYPGRFTVSDFLTTYLGIPIFLILYFGHKLVWGRRDPWLIAPRDVDLHTDLDVVEADAEMYRRESVSRQVALTGYKRYLGKVQLLWG